MLVVLIYNHPKTSRKQFLGFWSLLLSTLGTFKLNTIILGDININLSFNSGAAPLFEFLNLSTSFGYSQLTRDPARLNAILDHIYYNGRFNITTGSFPFSTSDHNLIYAILPNKNAPFKPKVIETRMFKSVIWSEVLNDLVPGWDDLQH